MNNSKLIINTSASRKTIMLVCIFLFTILPIFAQMRMVHGVVLDANGEPIIGANVVISGDAGRGTITDINGEFSLEASSKEKNYSFLYRIYQCGSFCGTNRAEDHS